MNGNPVSSRSRLVIKNDSLGRSAGVVGADRGSDDGAGGLDGVLKAVGESERTDSGMLRHGHGTPMLFIATPHTLTQSHHMAHSLLSRFCGLAFFLDE